MNDVWCAADYPAKSLMDLADCLASIPARAEQAKALEDPINKCLADLLSRGDNIGTEGETTFEDGAIVSARKFLHL